MNGSISAYDSSLFRNIFTSDRMRAEFTDRAYIEKCIEAEVALADAQAALGVIPADAGKDIRAGCSVDRLDFERLRKETDVVGYPILPLIRQLDGMCEGTSGKYLHWGATTQDVRANHAIHGGWYELKNQIMDIASTLQMKAGLAIIDDQLQAVRSILAGLAHKYRDTPMAGRTHLQHALPITFGYKMAVILSAFDRHYERLQQLRPRALMIQFGGAAGTLASLGDSDIGLRVRQKMAFDLGLTDPPISWHVARDGVAEAVTFLSLIGGTLGKLALDLIVMCSNEFSEVQEPFVPHRGASSTMPQKRNPISSEAMLAASKLLRNHASAAQDAMVADFERASGPWHLEWVCVPEAFCVASGALAHAEFCLGDLTVDTERMAFNLDSSKGLIVGEAVMMGIAPYVGRNAAHDIVYASCKACIEDGQTTLFDHLAKRPEVTEKISLAELKSLCDPRNYLGAAQRMTDQVIGTDRSSGPSRNGHGSMEVRKTKHANGSLRNGINGHGESNGLLNGGMNGH